MKTICTVAVLFAVATSSWAETTESRLRLENPGREGQVEIVLSDERVRTVEISVPGVISGESVTVMAPSPRVRLKGGTIAGDPLLEAVVQQKLRHASARPSTVSVLPAPQRYRQPDSSRYVNHVFTDVGYLYGPAWGGAATYPVRNQCCQGQQRSVQIARPSAPTRAAGGSASSRGMMPRR